MARFPIVGDVIDFILANEAQAEQEQLTREAMGRIARTPNYTFSEDRFVPSIQDVPRDVTGKQVEIDPALRANQLAALQRMQDIAEGRIESQGALERELAQRQASQMARGREDAVLQNMQSRGMGGSGMEFALRAQAGQEGASRAQMGGMQSAAQAALERLQSQNSYQQGLGNLRTQDTDLSARNADIINRFNAYNADRQTAARAANAMAQAQAKAANLQRSDRNVMARTNFQRDKTRDMNAMLGEQRGDVGRRYQPMFNLNDAFAQQMGNMLASGVGGEMGGQMGGQMGGAMGGMIGQQVGQQAMGQAMQQPSYSNVPPPQWNQQQGYPRRTTLAPDGSEGYWL